MAASLRQRFKFAPEILNLVIRALTLELAPDQNQHPNEESRGAAPKDATPIHQDH